MKPRTLAGLLERGPLAEAQRFELGRRRQPLAALDGRALEAEELEHGVADRRHRRDDAGSEYEQPHQGERKGAPEAGGREEPAASARSGLFEPRPDARRERGRVRVVELAAEPGECLLELGHATSSPSSLRKRSSARDRRDLTVPRAHSSTSAISSSESSRK